jgi:hypothetical protein
VFVHHSGGEGEIGRDHEIMWGHMLHDVLIDGIWFPGHTHQRHQGR